jgi:DNA-binding NarL/FixJ family response regulator
MRGRVVVADADGSSRRRLASSLRGCFELVIEASSGEEAIRAVEAHAPSVVIISIGLGGPTALETTRRVTTRHPGSRVLIVSGNSPESELPDALKAGAAGFLSGRAESRRLCTMIRIAVALSLPAVGGVPTEAQPR